MSPIILIISQCCMITNNLACLLQYWFSSVALNLVCISWSLRFRGSRGVGGVALLRKKNKLVCVQRKMCLSPTGPHWDHYPTGVKPVGVHGRSSGREAVMSLGEAQDCSPCTQPRYSPSMAGEDTYCKDGEEVESVRWGPSSWPKSLKHNGTLSNSEARQTGNNNTLFENNVQIKDMKKIVLL